jgi:tetratricopeptide (TPR) repeat protein
VNSAAQHVFIQPRKFRLKHFVGLVVLLLAGVLVAGVGYVKYQSLRRIRIAIAVTEKLNTSETLRQATLRVFVSDTREVILDGKVPSKEDFIAAGNLAASVPGVTQVINRVAYPPVIQATGPTGVPAQSVQSSEALISDGTKYLDDGKYAEAISCFSKAAEADPNNKGAKEWLERARQAHKTEEELLKNRR